MVKLHNQEIFQNQGCFSYLENYSNEIFVQCTWVEAQHIGLYSCVNFLHDYFYIHLLGFFFSSPGKVPLEAV